MITKKTGNTTGNRTHGEINISKGFGSIKLLPSSQLSGKTKFGLTHYSLNNQNNESRISGAFDLELSFPSYKSSNIFGKSATRVIKPSISYDYTRKDKQSNIPIFDTSDTKKQILTYHKLRSGERYDGIDRFTNENDITLSFQTVYKDNKKPNNDRFNFLLAQRYYGDDDEVSFSDSNDFEKRRKYSDIATSLDFSIDDFESLSTKIELQIDPKSFKVNKSNLSLILKPHERKFLSVSREDDGESRSLILSGAYPLSNKFHIFGGINKSLSSGIVNDETYGIAYEDCCWSARIAHFKESFVNDVADYDYSTGFELVFKGLGSSDTNLRNHIETNLPDYKVMLAK